MRLIDADVAYKVLTDIYHHRTEFQHEALKEALSKVPTVDAVEVVRCKDCIHKPRGTRNKHDMEFPDDICPCQCEDYWYSWMPYDDWFCANGERRKNETD